MGIIKKKKSDKCTRDGVTLIIGVPRSYITFVFCSLIFLATIFYFIFQCGHDRSHTANGGAGRPVFTQNRNAKLCTNRVPDGIKEPPVVAPLPPPPVPFNARATIFSLGGDQPPRTPRPHTER